MKLNAPHKTTWIIAVLLGIGGILGSYLAIPVLSTFAFWLIVLGWLLLVLSTYLKGI